MSDPKKYIVSVRVVHGTSVATLNACAAENGFRYMSVSLPFFISIEDKPLSEAMEAGTRLCRSLVTCGVEVVGVRVEG